MERDVFKREWKYISGFQGVFAEQVRDDHPWVVKGREKATDNRKVGGIDGPLLPLYSFATIGGVAGWLFQEDAFVKLIEALYPTNSQTDQSSRQALR